MLASKKVLIDAVVSDLISQEYPFQSSSLSSGTLENRVEVYLKALPQSLTDNSLTNNLNFRACKIYDGSKKDGKPDLSAQWFVYYSYKHPKTGKMVRHKIYKDINEALTIKYRTAKAKFWKVIYDTLLRAGYSPYEQYINQTTGDIDPNIFACIEMYLAEKKKVLAPKSYYPYSQHVGFFKKWVAKNKLAHYKISDFKRSHIKLFLSDYQERTKCGNRQVNNIKDNIITFFGYFAKNFEETLAKNPAAGLEDLSYKTQGNKAYTDKQIEQLKSVMQKTNPNMLFFCEMVYESCTRPHEEARLFKVKDLEFDQNRIHVRSELSKEGRSEYIPMSAKFMERLKKYVDGANSEDYLFTIDRNPGKAITNLFKPGAKPVSQFTLVNWYRKVKDECGMGGVWSIYSWAHTYCCRAYLDTKDIFFIKEKKRHTNLAVTSNYLRNMGLFVDLQKVAETVREF